MAENVSRPSPGRRNDFGKLKIRVADSLTLRDVVKLSTYFNITKAETDKMERSDCPGLDLVRSLESEGWINVADISHLVDGLRDCKLDGLLNDIQQSFPRLVSPPILSEEPAKNVADATQKESVPEAPDMVPGNTTFIIKGDDRVKHNATMKILRNASDYQVPVPRLVLDNCFISADGTGISTKSGVQLPVFQSVESLDIRALRGTEITDEGVLGLISYAKRCVNLKILIFIDCLLPLSISVDSLSSILAAAHFKVFWRPSIREFHLDFQTGNWNLIKTTTPFTLGNVNKNQRISEMCKERMYLRRSDSHQLQRSVLLILDIASSHNIPISELRLQWSFRGFDGDKIRLESGLCLPSVSSVEKISVNADLHQEISKEDVTRLIYFGLKSTRFTDLWFLNCKLPPSINPASITAEAKRRNVKVVSSSDALSLAMENGNWREPDDIQTIAMMCSDNLAINNSSSYSAQRSVIALLLKASNQNIPIFRVNLNWSFDKIDECGLNIILKSGFLLPNTISMEVMMIQTERGREMDEEVNDVLNYLRPNKRLKKLLFYDCVLPSPIRLGPSAYTLKFRNVEVFWNPDVNKDDQYYWLDLFSGHWEKRGSWTEENTSSYPW